MWTRVRTSPFCLSADLPSYGINKRRRWRAIRILLSFQQVSSSPSRQHWHVYWLWIDFKSHQRGGNHFSGIWLGRFRCLLNPNENLSIKTFQSKIAWCSHSSAPLWALYCTGVNLSTPGGSIWPTTSVHVACESSPILCYFQKHQHFKCSSSWEIAKHFVSKLNFQKTTSPILLFQVSRSNTKSGILHYGLGWLKPFKFLSLRELFCFLSLFQLMMHDGGSQFGCFFVFLTQRQMDEMKWNSMKYVKHADDRMWCNTHFLTVCQYRNVNAVRAHHHIRHVGVLLPTLFSSLLTTCCCMPNETKRQIRMSWPVSSKL